VVHEPAQYGNPGNNRIHVPLNFSLTAGALQAKGYRTHAIGKVS
jgi:hypothetical protein